MEQKRVESDDEPMSKLIKGPVKELSEVVKKILEEYAVKIAVTKLKLSLVDTKKDNFLSDVIWVLFEGVDAKNEPFKRKYVVKEVPKNTDYVNYYRCDVAFKNENEAYTNIIPNLNRFCPNELPTPHCIHTSDNVIVLEDLNCQGYDHFAKQAWDVPLVKLVLKQMANLHAGSLLMRQNEPETYKSITTTVQEIVYRPENTLLDTQEQRIDLALELVKEHPELVSVLRSLKGKTYRIQADLLKAQDEFSVINHGDLWEKNILVSPDRSDMKLLDFQIMRHTSIAADLSYFFFVNLDPKFLEENRSDFLKYYLRELVRNLGPGWDKLTMEWLEVEMRKYAPFGFICGLWISPIFYHTIGPFEKNQEQCEVFANTNVSVATLIENMTPEQKERTVGMIRTYAAAISDN